MKLRVQLSGRALATHEALGLIPTMQKGKESSQRDCIPWAEGGDAGNLLRRIWTWQFYRSTSCNQTSSLFQLPGVSLNKECQCLCIELKGRYPDRSLNLVALKIINVKGWKEGWPCSGANLSFQHFGRWSRKVWSSRPPLATCPPKIAWAT